MPMAIPNSSEILQAVIDATPDAIFVKDLKGRYILVNKAAARFLHLTPEQMIGKHDRELYPEETARTFVANDKTVLSSGEAHAFEGLATADDGSMQAYLVTKGVYRDRNGAIAGLFGISHDISELRTARQTLEETRDALFRAQKMEAVGQLTGGIAHDFNNILAVIIGSVELLRAYLPEAHDVSELVDAVLRAALHGRDLTGQLLAFSRRRLLNPQPVDVNTLVTNLMRLLGRTLGEAIHLNADISGEAGIALVDPSALEAAVLNIALNARDAMPGGGALTIRTARLDVGDHLAAAFDVRAGAYVRLSLEDTGSGMPPEVVARAFEPFFTTKTGAAGTGLGLSMVYGFAKQSGGGVTITSSPGKGTTVTLLLPVGEPAVAPETDAATQPAAITLSILVVEDDAEVRQVVKGQLESLGHEVRVVEAADDALDQLRHEPPDLLLTDVVLARGPDGIELAAMVRHEMPALPVIFMSGYTAVPEAQQRIRATGAPLLPKPFTTAQLAQAIQAAAAAMG